MTQFIKFNDVYKFGVTTHNPSGGALKSADELPRWSVFEDDSDTPILDGLFTLRTGFIGTYRGSFHASGVSGFNSNGYYEIHASGKVDSIVGRAIIDSFVIDDVVCADIVKVSGSVLPGAFIDVNVIEISNDPTAADNIELMYDGTGYTDTTAPASRGQVDNLGTSPGGAVNINASEDNTGGAIDPSSATFVGSVQGGTTFANTESEDGIYHNIDDTGDDIDIVYGFAVGGGRIGSAVSIVADISDNNDEIKVKVFDHVGSDWEIIGTIAGGGGSSFVSITPELLLKHTGTGSELGKVYIRFETDSTTPSNILVDKCLVAAVNIGQSIGYANGQIWLDTIDGTAGTEAFVNGVADNASDTLANVKTLATSIGIHDIHIINGSTIEFAVQTINESYFGDNWSLNLGDQEITNSYVQGATIDGSGIAYSEVHFEGCDFNIAGVSNGHFDKCGFSNEITHTSGNFDYHGCYSKGQISPVFNKTAGQVVNVEFQNWAGDIIMSGLQSGDIIELGGFFRTVTLAGADAIVHVHGHYQTVINNLTGSPTVDLTGAIKTFDTKIEEIVTVSGVVEGVWDQPISSNLIVGSFGESLQPVYYADIKYVKDVANANDEYSVCWFKNTQAVASGSITNPAISVYNTSTGASLFINQTLDYASTALGVLRHDSTLLTASGEPFLVSVSGTIDSANREWKKLVGLDDIF